MGLEALKLIQKNPDLALLNIVIPDLDGLRVLEKKLKLYFKK